MLNGLQASQLEAQIRDQMSAAQVSPEQLKKDQVEYVPDLWAWFKDSNEKLLKRHWGERKARLMKSLRSALYYLGHQVLVPKGNFGYRVMQLSGMDQPIYVMNKLRSYDNEITALWVQSNPEVEFAVIAENERQRIKTLDAIQDLNGHFNILHFTEKFLLNCAQFGQFDGNYTAETFFDPDSTNGMQWHEEFETQIVPEETWGHCFNCDSTGPLTPNLTCANCGSSDLEYMQMPGAQVDVPKQQGWKKAGEVENKFSNPWNHHYSYTTGPTASPWRYHEEDWAKEVTEDKFGKLDKSATLNEWQDDEMMHPDRIMRRAERQRSPSNSAGNYLDEDDCQLMQRFWREPAMLKYIASNKDETLPSGEVLPARTRLSEAYPQGMCILTVPGLNRFLDVFPDSHKTRFVDGIYGLSPGQQHGHGNDDAPEAQRQYNLLHSGEYRYVQRTFHPSIIAKKKAFRGENLRLFNRPDMLFQYQGDEDVRTIFSTIQAPELSPRIPLLLERLDAILQQTTGAQNSQGDFPGVPEKTATAARLGQSKTSARAGLHLILFAGFMKELRMRSLTLAQNHYGEMRLIQSTDPLSAKRRAKVLETADLRYSVMAYVKEGSYLPDLQEVKRANFLAAAQVKQQMMVAGISDPALDKQIDDLFQTDFAKAHRTERQYRCEEEYDEMQANLQQAMMMPDVQDAAMFLIGLRPTEVEEKGHEQKADWWRDLLGSPEGTQLPPVLREAIKLKIYAEAYAEMYNRSFIANAAAIGQGLLAPLASTGLNAQSVNKVSTPPPQQDPNAVEDKKQLGAGAEQPQKQAA